MTPDLATGVAPVLITPRVFDRDLCRALVAAHEGGQDISSQAEAIARSLTRNLGPMLRRAYQFHLHAIRDAAVRTQTAGGPLAAEALPGAEPAALFRCRVSLNAGAFQGGEVVFPEFGDRACRLPLGGALVFRSSLAHTLLPVTEGLSYSYEAVLLGGSVPPATALPDLERDGL